jgi:hypothetical protein
VFRSDVAFRIKAPPGVLLKWGVKPTGFYPEVVNRGCRSRSRWISLPGGYVVTKPGCYQLAISGIRSHQTQKVGIGIGTTCT